ncbi:hypothetical protein AB2L27_19905 [Kineococcus sp. LSe6-4]|uniref:Sporulation delaying protein family toxin n=1 Tax=Kineococcus halophytocola TaxID=3234027 RepID=A0ABV4H618_9ACTN
MNLIGHPRTSSVTKKLKTKGVASLILASVFLGVSPSIALADGKSTSAHEKSVNNTVEKKNAKGILPKKDKYSDEDVLKLLLAGQGPIAQKHPDLLNQLGFDPNRPMTDPAVLDNLVQLYMDYHPEFSNEIRRPLETGDPRAVERALIRLTEKYREFAQDVLGINSDEMVQARGACDGGAKACTVAYIAAVANGAVYANVAGATFVFVAAAAVFVVGPVAYLDDKTDPYQRMTSMEKDIVTLNLAKAMSS